MDRRYGISLKQKKTCFFIFNMRFFYNILDSELSEEASGFTMVF